MQNNTEHGKSNPIVIYAFKFFPQFIILKINIITLKYHNQRKIKIKLKYHNQRNGFITAITFFENFKNSMLLSTKVY